MNLLTPDDIEFTTKSHLSLKNAFHSLQRCDKFGIQREVITKRTTDGAPTQSVKEYFFIDGHEKEYTDLQDLCNDWNEIRSYDETDQEVIFIKVLKSKQ